jgi:hypothetical protein
MLDFEGVEGATAFDASEDLVGDCGTGAEEAGATASGPFGERAVSALGSCLRQLGVLQTVSGTAPADLACTGVRQLGGSSQSAAVALRLPPVAWAALVDGVVPARNAKATAVSTLFLSMSAITSPSPPFASHPPPP